MRTLNFEEINYNMIDFHYVEPAQAEVVVATDATRNGISKTQGSVYVEGGAEWDFGPVYVGASASNADYLVGADYDATAFVGARTDLAGFALDGRMSYTKVYGSPLSKYGMDDDALTFSGSASKKFGPVTAKVSASYTPEDIYFGARTWTVEGGASYRFGKNEVSGAVGHVDTEAFGTNVSYNTWNVGYTRDLTEKLAVDVRYYDTDLDVGYYSFAPAEGRTIASLKVKF